LFRSRFAIPAFVAAAIALALALPAVASAAQFGLTVHKAGTGTGTVECEVFGSGPAGPCAAKYLEGTELILYAIPNPGSKFVEWSGDCASEEPCELWMEEAHTVTAEFALILEFPLTVHKAGTGTGTVECEVFESGLAGPCAAKYPEGTELILYAIPNPGSKFVEWSGDCAGEEPCELWMEEAHTVTAEFALILEFKLTVTKTGTGTGTVTCDGGACASSYAGGSKVTLAATAASGSSFAGFSGGCSGTGSCIVTIAVDTTVTATFNANPPEPKGCPEDPSLCPPPPSEGTAKASATAPVSGGKAALKLTCSGGACKGTLKLTAKLKQGHKTKNMAIGTASFSLASGASATLKVKLSGAAKQELGKGKTIKAKLTGTAIAASTVKLKPGKK
jgi:hypothetical protein